MVFAIDPTFRQKPRCDRQEAKRTKARQDKDGYGNKELLGTVAEANKAGAILGMSTRLPLTLEKPYLNNPTDKIINTSGDLFVQMSCEGVETADHKDY